MRDKGWARASGRERAERAGERERQPESVLLAGEASPALPRPRRRSAEVVAVESLGGEGAEQG